MKRHIFFLGAGNIARAIEFLLKSNQDNEMEFWDTDLTKVPEQKPLETLTPWADIIFLCVNSWAMRKGLTSIITYLKKETIVVTATKGIENETGLWMHELLEELNGEKQRYGLLSGPMLAKEISNGMGGAAAFAAERKETYDAIAPLFLRSAFRLEFTDDVKGTAMCGVLKNIYALALGLASGLEYGSNMQGWLAMQSIKEMMKIVEKLGGRMETVLGTAGLGDFIATGFSEHSRNRTLGKEFALTGTFTVTSEGYASLPQFLKKIDYKTEIYPVLHALRLIFLESRNPKEVFLFI